MYSEPQSELIEYGSPDYEACLVLREEVLRKPLGLSFDLPQIRQDDKSYSFLVLKPQNSQELIACCLLGKISDNTLRIRQVAVSENYQRQGFGKLLMKNAEEIAKNQNYKIVTLLAREAAFDFYQKLGYVFTGEEEVTLGILHHWMSKQIK